MKKFKAIFLWICLCCVGTVLCACNFKDPVVLFSQNEIVLSAGDEVDLSQLLEVENLQKEKISFKFSNSALVNLQGSQAKAVASGRTFVYACIGDNVLASTELIVKKPFYAPERLKLSGNVLSWDAVSDVFEGESDLTVATKYTVSGTLQKPSQQPVSFVETVESTHIVLQQSGIYNLSVFANGVDFFDNGVASAAQTFYVGYMPKLTQSNFSFDDGVLSWDAEGLDNANFEVRLNGQLVKNTTDKSVNLTELLQNPSSTVFRATVKVTDGNNGEDKKLDQTSDSIVITKLSKPTLRVSDGRLEISGSKDTKKYIVFAGKQQIEIDCVNGLAQTTLDQLDAGTYEIEAKAYGQGFVFHSNASDRMQVLKLETPILSGTDKNEYNGSNFVASVQNAAHDFDTVFEIYGLSGNAVTSAEILQAGQTQQNITLQNLTAGTYNISIRAKAVNGTQNVICSNASEEKIVTKVKEFPSVITHKLVGKKSVLTFDKVDEDVVYGVQLFDGQDFVDITTDKYTVQINEQVTITFIEDVLVAQQDSFVFRVVANKDNAEFTVASAQTKQLDVLDAPTLLETGKEFSWQAVVGAKSYNAQVYLLTKQQYQNLQAGDEGTLDGLSYETYQTENTKISILAEGYYCVQVYAISGDTNRYLSSKNCLQSLFYITKQLSLGDVQFGFDLGRINPDEMTGASGYFVDIAASQDVTNYNLTIGTTTENFAGTKNKTQHNLTENFNTPKQLTIVAKGEDDTIYLPSAPYTFTVTKLKSVSASDLNSALVIDDHKEGATLTYRGQTGTTSLRVERSETDFATGTSSVTYKIKDLASFTLSFTVAGSAFDNNTKTFEIKDGHVYISPETSTVDFVRIDHPTDLAFANNELTFAHTAADNTAYYVLNINCTAADGAEFVASVRLASTAVAVIDGQSYTLGNGNVFFDKDNLSIHLAKVLESLSQNAPFSQAKIINFSVYAYQAKQNGSEQQIWLSSDFATTLQNEKSIEIKKMPTPRVTFTETETEYVLNITQGETDFAAATTFDVYDGTTKLTSEGGISGTTYAFTKDLLNHDLYVVAKNPHYLSSAQSNHVKLVKLNAVKALNLTADGKLTFVVNAVDAQNCTVLLYVDGVEKQTVTLEGNVGTLAIADFGAGEYALKLVADPAQILQDGTICEYINSEVSAWNVQELSSIKPTSTAISVENGNITWQALNQPEVNGLEYQVVFKGQNGIVPYVAATNSLNWQTDQKLRESLQGLSAGEVEISVSAHIKPYSAVVGGTIYFASAQTLLSGNQEYNHYVYTNKTIKKLSAPKIENVEFVNANGSKFNADPFAITSVPNVLVTFSGNYGTAQGDEATFQLYRDGTTEPLDTIILQRDANGIYQFAITADWYKAMLTADDVLTFKIYAVPTGGNSQDIASSYGEIVLKRAQPLTDITFEEDDLGYNHTLVLRYNTDYADQIVGGLTKNGINGGIVLEIVLSDGETETSTFKLLTVTGDGSGVIKCKLTDVLSSLTAGGTVQVKAYVNSRANGNDIFVASNSTVSNVYNLLKQPAVPTNADYGIKLDNFGDEDLVFVVEYNGQKFEVSSADNFKFVVPVSWTDGNYSLAIYAKKADNLASASLKYNFNLARIDAVQNVKFARNANNLVSLSWDAALGADGYIVSVYKNDNGNRGSLLVTVEGSATSYTLVQLFGENYNQLCGHDKFEIEDLMGLTGTALKLRFEIVAKGGTGKNNSVAYVQNCLLETNPTTTQNLSVDEFGNVIFAGEADKKYLYRFVSHNGEKLTNDAGEDLSAWQIVEGQILDTSKIEWSGQAINVEVLALGNLENAVPTLDSLVFTTLSQELNFFKLASITEISVGQTNGGSLVLTCPTNQFSHIYLGTSEQALKNKDVLAVNVSSIQPGAENDQYLVYVSLADILNYLSTKALSGNVTVQFWMQQNSFAPNLYIASMPASYSVQVSNDTGFIELVKGDSVTEEIDGVSTTYTNLTNTYATFENSGFLTVTAGFYVKISQGAFWTIKFVSNEELETKNGKLYLNLTKLFEEDNLLGSDGNFEIDFARLNVSLSGPIISNWHSTSFDKVLVERLDAAPALLMQNGNLIWENIVGDASKYYLYFYTSLEGDQFTYVAVNPQDNNVFNASSFAGTDGKYYIAVQAVSEKQNAISSRKVFKLDANGDAQLIYKNQIKSPLKLKDGNLYMDWTVETGKDNFVSVLFGDDYAETITSLTTQTFTSPFTFTLADLVDNKVKVRLRFTKDGEVKGNGITVDVDAMDLMADLFKLEGYNVLERLNLLIAQATQVSDQRLLSNFKERLQNASCGVANRNKLFDEYFESIQTGAYGLEYCLVEGTKTLNSQWYNFEKVVDEAGQQSVSNVVYVNAQPNINVLVESQDAQKINTFMVLIEKSKVWNYIDGQYVQEFAKNYVLKIGDRTFDLDANLLTLTQHDADKGSVSVYTRDSQGGNTANTHLMFYLNYNGGDSFLGKFGNSFVGDQNFEIYAVGNDYSFSSKSEFYKINFLQFGNLQVVDGAFVWTTYQGRATTVGFKLLGEESTFTYTKVDGSRETAQFCLDNKTYGAYAMQMIMEGEVRGNMIIVDSDLLSLPTVYKLQQPTLNNNLGYIGIIATNSSRDSLKNAYSDGALYSYQIYNNISGVSNFKTLSDTRDDTLKVGALLYEAGTANLSQSSPDWAYKSTEILATQFYVGMLGSSCKVGYVQENDTDQYYVKRVVCLDVNGQEVSGNVALKSTFSRISATMMDAVSGLTVQEGIISWQAVQGNAQQGLLVDEEIVYKVVISKYVESYTSSGISQSEIQENATYYTALNTFDMAMVEKTDTDMLDNIKYKVSVQALALSVADGEGYADSKPLVEGGYAYGNTKYQGTDIFVLMGNVGNYSTLDGISRLKGVDNLHVENGCLAWQFAPEGQFNTETLLNYFNFVVADDKNNEIYGTFEIEQDGTNFNVKFVEDAGQMPAGTYNINVFVTAGRNNSAKAIKSYAQQIEITKLATLSQEEVEISTENLEAGIEILSLENYFKANPNNQIRASFVNGQNIENFTFTAAEFKIYVLSAPLSSGQSLSYANVAKNANGDGFIVVGNTEKFVATFKVVNTQPNTLYSDVSNPFDLHRIEWADSQITWQDEQNMFSWSYDSPSGQEVVYVITATYFSQYNENGLISVREKRTYTTTESSFKPTIIGAVQISVRIKASKSNLISQQLVSGVEKFDLFESGDGESEETAYVIENETQFANIAYRLSKDQMLNTYTVNNIEKQDASNKFFFKLAKDLNLVVLDAETGETNFMVNGILFKGQFAGVLDACGHSITYTSTGVSQLSNSVEISRADTAMSLSNSPSDQGLTFRYGSALFESLSESAVVKNLNINVCFGKLGTGADKYVKINFHSLMAGLCITNAGQIENVNMASFENNFRGNLTSRAVMVYSGIASKNAAMGSIKNCSSTGDILVNDFNNAQLIFVSGIVYTNYGTVQNCTSGAANSTLQVVCNANIDSVQMAGIAITNVGEIADCTNLYNLRANGNGSDVVCYMAGIVVLTRNGTLSVSQDANLGRIDFDSTISVQQGNIYTFA